MSLNDHHRCDGYGLHPHLVMGIPTEAVVVENRVAQLCRHCMKDLGRAARIQRPDPSVPSVCSVVESRKGLRQ